jgi:membrane protease YdiL (CAAX protease family)
VNPLRLPLTARFLLLAYALSWWPWLGRLGNPEAAVLLPVGPSVAALLVLAGQRHRARRRALLRSLWPPRDRRWWTALLLPPLVAATAVLLAVVSGAGSVSPDGPAVALLTLALLPLTAVVAGPLGEELGWRGFLLPELLRRHSVAVSTAIVTAAWLVFHLPLLVTEPARYGLPWAIMLASASVVMTGLHLGSGGSTLLAVAFHAVTNSATAAAVQLVRPADRPLVWWLVAGSWAALAVASAVAARRTTSSPRLSPVRDRAESVHEGAHR